jgi:hypothetical protein
MTQDTPASSPHCSTTPEPATTPPRRANPAQEAISQGKTRPIGEGPKCEKIRPARRLAIEATIQLCPWPTVTPLPVTMRGVV